MGKNWLMLFCIIISVALVSCGDKDESNRPEVDLDGPSVECIPGSNCTTDKGVAANPGQIGAEPAEQQPTFVNNGQGFPVNPTTHNPYGTIGVPNQQPIQAYPTHNSGAYQGEYVGYETGYANGLCSCPVGTYPIAGPTAPGGAHGLGCVAQRAIPTAGFYVGVGVGPKGFKRGPRFRNLRRKCRRGKRWACRELRHVRRHKRRSKARFSFHYDTRVQPVAVAPRNCGYQQAAIQKCYSDTSCRYTIPGRQGYCAYDHNLGYGVCAATGSY